MRVAIVINKLVSAGAERLVVDQISEFGRRGIQVDLITLAPEREGDSFMSLVELPASAKHRFVFSSLFTPGAWIKLTLHLRRTKPDVLMTHLWFGNTVGRIAGSLAGVPTIVSFEHNVYDNVKTRKQFAVDRLLQSLSSGIVAVSGAVRDSLVRHGIKKERVIVVENGIDLSRYRDSPPADVPKKGFTYLFVGRLIHQKGTDILVDAFACSQEGELWIVGEGGERPALTDRAKDLGITGRVSFLGIREDVPSLLKTADCFVLPSRHEGMPIVLIEAMASGRPCIVSDFSSARDVLRDGISGVVVPVNDANALAEAMEHVRLDPAFRARLAEAGTRDAERFSIKTHVDTLMKYVFPH